MVEFSAVLIAKQRFEWNQKSIKTDDNQCKSRIEFAPKFCEYKAAANCSKELQRLDSKAENEVKSQFLGLNRILSPITIWKNIPPYRKADIIAFMSFAGFYLCFNMVYFYVCINY